MMASHILRESQDEKRRRLIMQNDILDIQLALRKVLLLLERPNTQQSVKYLDALLRMDLDPLTLKKHPVIVETIEKLRKYKGSPIRWKLNNQEKEMFFEEAELLRSKAEKVYIKMESLFEIPEGHSFINVFELELKKFKKSIKGMSPNEKINLTSDPSITKYFETLPTVANICTSPDQSSANNQIGKYNDSPIRPLQNNSKQSLAKGNTFDKVAADVIKSKQHEPEESIYNIRPPKRFGRSISEEFFAIASSSRKHNKHLSKTTPVTDESSVLTPDEVLLAKICKNVHL